MISSGGSRAVSTVERELNEYLFHELGAEGDASAISADWPFRLRPLGSIAGRAIFELESDGEEFFALAGTGLDVLPRRGMQVDDLALQLRGGDWIAARDPVGLEESRLGDDSVPAAVERRRALTELAADALGVSPVEILEGFYLRREQRYVALAGAPGAVDAWVVGLGTPLRVEHAACSAWRRLAWGVGSLRLRGTLR